MGWWDGWDGDPGSRVVVWDVGCGMPGMWDVGCRIGMRMEFVMQARSHPQGQVLQ